MSAKPLSAKKGLARNFFSLSLFQIANNLLPLLTVPIIVRIIGPDKFGALNFSASLITYFSLLINYGFDLTATRAIAKNKDNKEERNRIFSEVLFAKMLLLSICIVVFVFMVIFVPQISAEKELYIFTFISCLALVITPNWLYQGMQELHHMAVFNFVTKLLFTISIILLIREKQDYILQPFIISMSGILVGVCSFVWAIKRYAIKIFKVTLNRILSLLWEDKMVFFSTIVIALYTVTNTIVLGIVQSNEDVAFYSAGWKLISFTQTLISIPLSLSLFPFIGESFGRDKSEGLNKVKQITPFVTILTALSGVAIWVLAPSIINIFYGPAFQEATSVLRILCFIPLIIALSNLFGIQTMINLKMDKPFFKIILLGALVGLCLNFFFSREFGATGTAWAWLLTEILITLFLWLFLYFNQIQLIEPAYFRYGHLMQVVRPFIFSIKQKIYK